MPEETTSEKVGIERVRPEENTTAEQLRARMEAACGRLADANGPLTECCDQVKAVLDVPVQDFGAIRQASAAARAAGMRSIGLTSDYLLAFHKYMDYMESLGA